MFRNRFWIICLICIFLLGLAACNMPTAATGSGDPAVETGRAQTDIANAINATLATLQTSPPETPTPGYTETPSLTPSPSFSPTPNVPVVSVSVATNCRTGPGKVYDNVGALLVGQTAEIFGRDTGGQYWYIRNPDNPATFCWLWGNYATVSGNTGALPVYTPLPSPTPAPGFDVSFSNVDVCVGWYIEFNLTNTGSLAWESVEADVTDNTTAVSNANPMNIFQVLTGCLSAGAQNDLMPGETGKTNSASFGYNPAGHNITATIKVCSVDGLGGTCITKTISFTP